MAGPGRKVGQPTKLVQRIWKYLRRGITHNSRIKIWMAIFIAAVIIAGGLFYTLSNNPLFTSSNVIKLVSKQQITGIMGGNWEIQPFNVNTSNYWANVSPPYSAGMVKENWEYLDSILIGNYSSSNIDLVVIEYNTSKSANGYFQFLLNDLNLRNSQVTDLAGGEYAVFPSFLVPSSIEFGLYHSYAVIVKSSNMKFSPDQGKQIMSDQFQKL